MVARPIPPSSRLRKTRVQRAFTGTVTGVSAGVRTANLAVTVHALSTESMVYALPLRLPPQLVTVSISDPAAGITVQLSDAPYSTTCAPPGLTPPLAPALTVTS